MGRSGNALVMLLPHEEPYVDFLRLRKVISLTSYFFSSPSLQVPFHLLLLPVLALVVLVLLLCQFCRWGFPNMSMRLTQRT